MKSRPLRLNAPVTSVQNEALRIDRDNLRVYGSVAALANVEALGHGLWSDQKTILTLAALGNQSRYGIRMRFGHPGMSENAMGKKVGRAFNFRVEGDKLLHDIRLFAAADESPVLNKPVSYILDMAEQHPEEIAESVVIQIQAMWTLDDGRELDADEPDSFPDDVITENGRPVNATTPFPVIRPMTFYYTDFVAEGALTHDGLFSMGADELFVGTSRHAAQMFEVMEDLQATYGLTTEEMRRKADALFNMYETWHRGDFIMSKDTIVASDAKKVEANPVAKPASLETLIADSAALAEQVNGEHTEPQPQYVTLEAHQAVVTQLNTVTEAFNALDERFNQLVEVFSNQQSILSKLTQQQVRLTGEPIVTAQVPAHANHSHGFGQSVQPVPDLSTMRVPPSLVQKGTKGGKQATITAEETAVQRAMRLNSRLSNQAANI